MRTPLVLRPFEQLGQTGNHLDNPPRLFARRVAPRILVTHSCKFFSVEDDIHH